MAGSRVALVVANDRYGDPGLRSLMAPAHDAAALAEVLADPAVGGFDVRVLQNESAQAIRLAVEDFFADRSPEDLLLLHFSCHGLKNAAGELFLAVADTRPTRLASTAVAADFVNRQMADSRAQRIALFLDCCYGGAFPRGLVVRAAGEAQVRDAFAGQDRVGGGRGRVVVTASSAMEYAFEGGQLATDASKPSVFTSAVVDGLTSGDADRDGDGWVGLTELVGYVTDRVRRVTPNQNPQMWTFGSQGELLIARSRVRRITPAELAPELVEAMESPLSAARFGVVDYLRERLSDPDLSQAYAAWQALGQMVDDDSRKVSEAARRALAEAVPRATPEELDFSTADQTVLQLTGPPIALTAVASATAPWLTIEQTGAAIRVTATPSAAGPQEASVTLTGPTGDRTIPVRLRTADLESMPEPQPLPEPTPDPEPIPEPEPPATARAAVPWWVVGVLLVGALLLVLVNWPGATDSRKIWSDEAQTGWRVYRSPHDPEILASVFALAASLVVRWSGRWALLVLGVALGSVLSLLEDGVLILLSGLSADETTAWTVATALSLGMAAVLLFHLWPGRWPLRPVPPPAAALVVAGGIMLVLSPLITHPDGFSFFTVTELAVLEPLVVMALAWPALAATDPRAKLWLSTTATTYAAISMIAAVPALTDAASPPAFLTSLLGNALVIAGVAFGLRRRASTDGEFSHG
ncbi:hypothetical protein GCM10009789_31150 [Kribbella sancticallisti]|uniref:Peptidase C14 caspase domain-containing protein n=1 Tax=Kribbella sancticallisti TaxID=460087 RepID=A0ABP4P850_9ACTN